jgi:general secretion pathway protein A
VYREFYGLKELPFALTPDPRFIYFTPSHTEVMANLHYGIESGKGLVVVTGEVGTGKTTILRWILQRLDRTVLVAYVFNPRLTVPEFYQHIATLLDVQQWETKSELLIALGKTLESRHSRGLRTVLIVDEAQGLSPYVLEEIRLLSNFESDSAKHLQIVLTGQPELRSVVNSPDLRQLKQRVALRCEIKPLPNIEETAETFDMLPRSDTVRQAAEEREAPARIFTAAGRAELWAAGTGNEAEAEPESASPLAMREEAETKQATPDADELGAAFRQSGLLGGM